MEKKRYCPNCGAELSVSEESCSECRRMAEQIAKAKAAAAAAAKAAATTTTATSAESGKKDRRPLFIIIAVAIIVVIGIVIAVSSSAKDSNVEERGKPSFNCAKASIPSEKAICSNVDLGELDGRLAVEYLKAISACKKNVQKEQVEWIIKRRNTCLSNVQCLTNVYKIRIYELKNCK